jgi:hypothetical protein
VRVWKGVDLGGRVEGDGDLLGAVLHGGLHAGDEAVVAVGELGDVDLRGLGEVVGGGPALQRRQRELLAVGAGEGERGAEAAHRRGLRAVGGGGGVPGGGRDGDAALLAADPPVGRDGELLVRAAVRAHRDEDPVADPRPQADLRRGGVEQQRGGGGARERDAPLDGRESHAWVPPWAAAF